MANELKRIFCIDDDPDILEVARLCLETVGGFDVKTCLNSAEALDQVREAAPDIILMDVMMPVMDGPTILKQLRADPELQKYPVIFMTARVQPREVDEYLALGAVAVIAKPFDPMQIAAEIATIWKKLQQR